MLSRKSILALANQAERGDLTALGTLFRALGNGELASGIDPVSGAGFRSGTGGVVKSNVVRSGGIVRTELLVDLTGLASSTTDVDIIGVGTSPAYFMKWTAERNGLTPFAGTMKCLEVPAGGVTDIDMYATTEGTGVFDGLVTDLAETALLTSGGAWSLALEKAIADPASMLNKYFYLTCGAGGTAATYTAGKFLLTFFGYDG